MTWMWAIMALAVTAFAPQERPQAEARSSGWSPVEQAEVHGRCFAGSVGEGMDEKTADRMCRCVVAGLSQSFSYAWLDDGRQITADEAQQIRAINVACAHDQARSAPGPGPGAQGTGVTAIE